MPAVWATMGELDAPTQERPADVPETWGADPRQQEMRQAFLREAAASAKHADVPDSVRGRRSEA
jgi:hypothetical protein